nr:MAG TPA: protein of unknown function (DUF4969) [Caudoviricetes sp.]
MQKLLKALKKCKLLAIALLGLLSAFLLSSCTSTTQPSVQVQAKVSKVDLPYALTVACKDPQKLQSTQAQEVLRVLYANALALEDCKNKHKHLLRISKTLFQYDNKMLEPTNTLEKNSEGKGGN